MPLSNALPPRRVALIVAAGKGERAGGDRPKQFAIWHGKPLLRHSVEAFFRWGGADCVLVVSGERQGGMAKAALEGMGGVHHATGGATRRDSVRNGLSAIEELGGCERVFIHDAARPGLGSAVLDRLDAALDARAGAAPALPVIDSVAYGEDWLLSEAIERSGLVRVQTPQAFHFDTIVRAHREWPENAEATDDARMVQALGEAVALVEGDEALHKITFAGDFQETRLSAPSHLFRTGLGYDVHRLAPGEELWLCGLRIEHDKGLAGHSDADVALHAITDALLGAMALGDIGEHFPPSDPQWKGASSDRFLAHAADLVRGAGGTIVNLDLTIICEAPRIGPHKAAMRARVSEILGLDVARVSVKATTTERLGFTGRGEGIGAEAIATVMIPA